MESVNKFSRSWGKNNQQSDQTPDITLSSSVDIQLIFEDFRLTALFHIKLKIPTVIEYIIFDDYYHLRHRRISKRSLKPSEEHHIALSNEPQVTWFSQQVLKRRIKRDFKEDPESEKGIKIALNDPRWPQMWYLNRGEGLDMNVQDAWAQGVTGKGVVVTILDDGLEKDHPDLIKNY
ncbi:furin-like, partial [Stegodyphus dumicola]|uniref:furin-like n=1 Tax=Stegodyphus dumicola TaxID=202533 RepID=UPI0015AA1CF6